MNDEIRKLWAEAFAKFCPDEAPPTEWELEKMHRTIEDGSGPTVAEMREVAARLGASTNAKHHRDRGAIYAVIADFYEEYLVPAGHRTFRRWRLGS